MEMYRYSGGTSNNEFQFQSIEINGYTRDSKTTFWSSSLSFEEKAITIVKRLYYSEFSKYLYLGIFLLNLLVLFIGLFKQKSGSIFCVLMESVITFTLTFEVMIKLFLMKERFFNSLNNNFDFVVALTCLTLLFLNGDIYRLFFSNKTDNLENNQIVTDIFEQVLTSTRFCLQMLRVFTITRIKGKTESVLGTINFDRINNLEDSIYFSDEANAV